MKWVFENGFFGLGGPICPSVVVKLIVSAEILRFLMFEINGHFFVTDL